MFVTTSREIWPTTFRSLVTFCGFFTEWRRFFDPHEPLRRFQNRNIVWYWSVGSWLSPLWHTFLGNRNISCPIRFDRWLLDFVLEGFMSLINRWSLSFDWHTSSSFARESLADISFFFLIPRISAYPLLNWNLSSLLFITSLAHFLLKMAGDSQKLN